MKLGEIGKYKVLRETDLGYMLVDLEDALKEDQEEVFLHRNETNFKKLYPGDVVSAFLYLDKQKRVAATLYEPLITTTKGALCKVVNKTTAGAFFDIGISKDILKQASEAYRKIRNTFRFLLGNLSDFNDKTDRVEYSKLSEVDRYMECRLSQVVEKVLASYKTYEFQEVYRTILNYMTNDLSAFYMDFTKDILYIEEKDNILRRSIQTVLFDNLDTMLRLLTPIIPFTSEEIYSFMNVSDKLASSYLLEMPKAKKYDDKDLLLDKYTKFMNLRSDVLKAIEDARN